MTSREKFELVYVADFGLFWQTTLFWQFRLLIILLRQWRIVTWFLWVPGSDKTLKYTWLWNSMGTKYSSSSANGCVPEKRQYICIYFGFSSISATYTHKCRQTFLNWQVIQNLLNIFSYRHLYRYDPCKRGAREDGAWNCMHNCLRYFIRVILSGPKMHGAFCILIKLMSRKI
jgi:hypothetical protein